ncbi:LPS assembly protein LptD [Shewanella sp. VB17]|uniref:LPS assembly protein LptD n=1 Tax=Shewanella sp. VB17 TaxID=2739432 RepID=UPI00156329C3|nr:LPS assembly protein LptD [Shewanella sp. VB17]NRD72604.1 LPS assembly protein LptD [Shewanella sp. VB17]
MQTRYLLALSLLPQLVLAEETTMTSDATMQCIVEPPVPHITAKDNEDTDYLTQEIRIMSNRSEAQMGQQAKFTGDVSFSQGNRNIAADEAILDQQKEQLDANGSLIFQDPMITITADSLIAEMRTNTASLWGAQYWLNGRQIHGNAEKLEITPDNDLHLSKTNFTSCPPGDSSWLFEADTIKIDSTEESLELSDAKLKIGGVPVFYIPYMSVPISNKRKSGFLFPEFGNNSTNGMEISTPYYWNISPEYDLTLTPNYMTSRGLFLKTDFRYLAGESQQGGINLEYLNDDDMLADSPSRYLYHWDHKGSINENWRVMADFTDVSDDNYFSDLDSDVQQSTDNQISRIGEMSYLEKNWDFSARVQDIKVLGEDEKPYQVMPQIDLNYRSPNFWNGFDFAFFGEATNFENDKNDQPDATRLHLEPTMTYPIHGPAGSLTSEFKLLQTYYWQDINDLTNNQQLDNSVSRTLPQVRFHGQINFERFTSYFDENYRQTLEPQFQYLYVGYEEQNNIGIYDTAKMQEDYFGLFRDRRFSGIDRIADANQLTLGLTTRLFDQHNQETFKFSLGQIHYFKESKVGISDPTNQTGNFIQENSSNSVLAAELSTKLYQDWYMSGSIQYDTKLSDNKKTEVTLDFRPGVNKLLQFSYRYVPDLQDSNIDTDNADSVDISQTGIRGAWPVNDNIYLIADWYYDLNERRNIETYAGFQYESCCWAIGLGYYNRLKANYDNNIDDIQNNRELFDSGISFTFTIRGLGGSGPLGVSHTFDDGLFNYRKPLYLTD